MRDNCDEGIYFANKRGFVEKKHSIEMMFDLSTWEEAHYTPILQALKAQGFRFTNMAELGDTPEARRKLYILNNSAAATDPGSDGIPPWASFEEFEKYVCNSSWYHPDGQIVAIDTHTGEWAAMSAITVFDGADHAYNLFTGTDVRYRGRKLAQAVKALALRKARTFGVGAVRTSHNSENAAMIAIDTKLGYVRTPGVLIMEKELDACLNPSLKSEAKPKPSWLSRYWIYTPMLVCILIMLPRLISPQFGLMDDGRGLTISQGIVHGKWDLSWDVIAGRAPPGLLGGFRFLVLAC